MKNKKDFSSKLLQSDGLMSFLVVILGFLCGTILVAIVGRNMATKVGMSAKLFSIFGKNNINIKVIAQASQELSIIVGVQNSQFENAIKAIYDNLV